MIAQVYPSNNYQHALAPANTFYNFFVIHIGYFSRKKSHSFWWFFNRSNNLSHYATLLSEMSEQKAKSVHSNVSGIM